jgi:hypothetical protein
MQRSAVAFGAATCAGLAVSSRGDPMASVAALAADNVFRKLRRVCARSAGVGQSELDGMEKDMGSSR